MDKQSVCSIDRSRPTLLVEQFNGLWDEIAVVVSVVFVLVVVFGSTYGLVDCGVPVRDADGGHKHRVRNGIVKPSHSLPTRKRLSGCNFVTSAGGLTTVSTVAVLGLCRGTVRHVVDTSAHTTGYLFGFDRGRIISHDDVVTSRPPFRNKPGVIQYPDFQWMDGQTALCVGLRTLAPIGN
jgi:hypothetical protein